MNETQYKLEIDDLKGKLKRRELDILDLNKHIGKLYADIGFKHEITKEWQQLCKDRKEVSDCYKEMIVQLYDIIKILEKCRKE